MKHLLKLLDLSSEEIVSILDLADQLTRRRTTSRTACSRASLWV